MSVTATASSISYDGNDVADEFAVPFKFMENGHLTVRHTDALDVETTLVEGTDYTVDGAGEDDGGTVTTTDPVATDCTLVIERNTDITQESDFSPQGAFPVSRHEQAIDKLTLICQELARRVAVLEALGDLVEISEAANAATASGSVTGSDPIEDTFPFNVTFTNALSIAHIEFRAWNAASPGAELDEPPQLQWTWNDETSITVIRISGIEPGVEYDYAMLAFYSP